MYHYDQYDQTVVDERVAQFRDQTRRFLTGELSEDQYRPLRLMNGLYIQRHAPMLRVAIPYGLLSTRQLRMLAHIARRYDKGYGHFTTRQNIQFNWPRLEEVPDILADLATVQMHAIQTSGNCIRNVTTIIWPVSRQMNWKTRAFTAKSSGSGRPSTPSSASCRASSKLRSTEPRRIGPPPKCMTLVCNWSKMRAARPDLKCWLAVDWAELP